MRSRGKRSWDGWTWLFSHWRQEKISQRGKDKSMKLHVWALGLGLTHHHSDTAEEEETPAWPGSACLMGAMFWEELRANYTKVPFNRKQLFSPNHITSDTDTDGWAFQNYLKGKSSWRSHLQAGSCSAAFTSSTSVKQISIPHIRKHLYQSVILFMFLSYECEYEGTWSELWSYWCSCSLSIAELILGRYSTRGWISHTKKVGIIMRRFTMNLGSVSDVKALSQRFC